jgi:hypothetical protein
VFEDIRRYIKTLGLPEGDLWDLPTSTARFPDGAVFRIEVPTVNSAEAVTALLETSDKLGVTINRVTETYGMFRHTRQELKEYCRLCHDYGAELLLSVGPRATYDTSATALSPQGVRIGYRLRGMEQLLRAVEDIRRGIDIGCRGFVIYNEGLLWVLGRMRRDGFLPKDIIFKASAHMGYSNPAAFKVLEELGADSINPVPAPIWPAWASRPSSWRASLRTGSCTRCTSPAMEPNCSPPTSGVGWAPMRRSPGRGNDGGSTARSSPSARPVRCG